MSVFVRLVNGCLEVATGSWSVQPTEYVPPPWDGGSLFDDPQGLQESWEAALKSMREQADCPVEEVVAEVQELAAMLAEAGGQP